MICLDEDSPEFLEPSQKRARVESHAAAGPSSAVSKSSASKNSDGRPDEGDSAWITPFSLLKVQGIPAYGNRSDLVCYLQVS